MVSQIIVTACLYSLSFSFWQRNTQSGSPSLLKPNTLSWKSEYGETYQEQFVKECQKEYLLWKAIINSTSFENNFHNIDFQAISILYLRIFWNFVFAETRKHLKLTKSRQNTIPMFFRFLSDDFFFKKVQNSTVH